MIEASPHLNYRVPRTIGKKIFDGSTAQACRTHKTVGVAVYPDLTGDGNYLSDQILRCGGYIALDDMWMRSVRTAASFIRSNRAYVPTPEPDQNMMILQKQDTASATLVLGYLLYLFDDAGGSKAMEGFFREDPAVMEPKAREVAATKS